MEKDEESSIGSEGHVTSDATDSENSSTEHELEYGHSHGHRCNKHSLTLAQLLEMAQQRLRSVQMKKSPMSEDGTAATDWKLH